MKNEKSFCQKEEKNKSIYTSIKSWKGKFFPTTEIDKKINFVEIFL